jgi:hypothetical protein
VLPLLFENKITIDDDLLSKILRKAMKYAVQGERIGVSMIEPNFRQEILHL